MSVDSGKHQRSWDVRLHLAPERVYDLFAGPADVALDVLIERPRVDHQQSPAHAAEVHGQAAAADLPVGSRAQRPPAAARGDARASGPRGAPPRQGARKRAASTPSTMRLESLRDWLLIKTVVP